MAIDPIRVAAYDVFESTIYNMMVQYGDRHFVSEDDLFTYEDTAPGPRSRRIESLLLLRRMPRRLLLSWEKGDTYRVLADVRLWLDIRAFIGDVFPLSGLRLPETTYSGKPYIREGLRFSQLMPGDQDTIYQRTKFQVVCIQPHVSDEERAYIYAFWRP